MSNQPTLVHLGQYAFQIGDLVNAGLLALAILSLWITIYRMVKGTRAQRAAVFKEAYLAAFASPAMLDALSIVELDKFRATIKHGAVTKNFETQVNVLLGFANCVCAMYKLKLISKREVETFAYLFLVLYRSKEVQKYYLFLKSWTRAMTGGRSEQPYHYWMNYCRHKLGQPEILAKGLEEDESASPVVTPAADSQ